MANTRSLARVGGWEVKEVSGETASGAYKMFVLQKDTKQQDGTWKNESIILKPAELPAVAALCERAFALLCEEAAAQRNQRKMEGGAEF